MSPLEAVSRIAESSSDPHEQLRQSNVHPATWVNPSPAGRYNLVVIGGGAAGLVSAAGAAGLGARVALIERDLLGGDCLNTGCVPSKALLRSAKAYAEVRGAGELGIEVPGPVRVDFPAVMERMRRLRAGISKHDAATRFRELGIDVYFGQARFSSRQTVEVAGTTLHFRRAGIATGARAAQLPIPGLAEAGALSNETVFSLTELPESLAVIGAGPIGCELSQAFARFGSGVTLLEAMPQILPREDRDAAAVVRDSLLRDGIDLRTGVKVQEIRSEGSHRIVRLEDSEGRSHELRVDQILVGVGRAPNVEGLGLEEAEVVYDRSGVQVDDRLRTSNRRIYAAGDICASIKLTHHADAQARILIQNALFWGWSKASALTLPWSTYTDPEVAHVGLYEEEARERGLAVETIRIDFDSVDRAVLDGETEGFLKVHFEPKKGRILGATLVGRHAGDLISEITLAMKAGATLGTLAATIHPYPTRAEILKKAGDTFQRRRLTPTVAKVLRTLLRWQR